MNYTRAHSVEQAVEAHGAHPGACYLAGGQALVPALRRGAAPHALIDLGRVPDLARIRAEGSASLSIGALATHAAVAGSRDVQGLIPGLAILVAQIGDRQLRELATLGGALAEAHPASCVAAALLGLGARVHTDRRVIEAEDFFPAPGRSALAAGELILRVEFPVPRQSAYEKFRQPASRFALVGVFVARGPGGVRVAVTGAGSRPGRNAALEAALTADWSAAAARAVALPAADCVADLHGSAAYRAALVPELCARAVINASIGTP